MLKTFSERQKLLEFARTAKKLLQTLKVAQMLLSANEKGLVSAYLGEGAYLSVGAVSVIRLDQFGYDSFAINQGTSAFKYFM